MVINELKVIYDKMYLPMLAIESEKKVPKKIYNGSYKADYIYSLMEYIYNISHLMEENAYIVAFYDSTFIGTFHLSRGTDENCDMEVKSIYRFLLLAGANRYTIIHNHPNCVAQMSQDDYKITKKLMEINDLFNIQMINHIVIGRNEWRCIDFDVLEMDMNGIDDTYEYYRKVAKK